MTLLSTKATCNTHGQDSSYFLGWEEYEKNPYDEVLNPNGIIQMGLAENQVGTLSLAFWLIIHFILSWTFSGSSWIAFLSKERGGLRCFNFYIIICSSALIFSNRGWLRTRMQQGSREMETPYSESSPSSRIIMASSPSRRYIYNIAEYSQYAWKWI